MCEFLMQNVELEDVESVLRIVKSVRKLLEIIGFKLPPPAEVTVTDWVSTRKNRYWVEFSVDRESAHWMRAQRSGRKEQLEKWNTERFGPDKSLHVTLKSMDNFIGELAEPTRSPDSTQHHVNVNHVKMEPLEVREELPVVPAENVKAEEEYQDGYQDQGACPEYQDEGACPEYQDGGYQDEYQDWVDYQYQEPQVDHTEVLRKFPFVFRIQALPVEMGMMQETAVTQFLVRLGLPTNVTFRILNFTDRPSDSAAMRFDAEIAIDGKVHEKLCSANARLALLLLNEQKSMKNIKNNMENHTLLIPLPGKRERTIQNVLEQICALLSREKSRELFSATVNGRNIEIRELGVPMRSLTVLDVHKLHLKEYLEVVTSQGSEEVFLEMKAWLGELQDAPRAQGAPGAQRAQKEQRASPVAPRAPLEVANELMSKVCEELMKGKIKADYNAVARNNTIMIYVPNKSTIPVKYQDVPKRFGAEFYGVLKKYPPQEADFMKRQWAEALAEIAKQELAEQSPRQHALNEMMTQFCVLSNGGKLKTQWNAFHKGSTIFISRFRKKTEELTLFEAFRKFPDVYQGARKKCSEMVRSELKIWEKHRGIVLKRGAEDENRGPEAKIAR